MQKTFKSPSAFPLARPLEPVLSQQLNNHITASNRARSISQKQDSQRGQVSTSNIKMFGSCKKSQQSPKPTKLTQDPDHHSSHIVDTCLSSNLAHENQILKEEIMVLQNLLKEVVPVFSQIITEEDDSSAPNTNSQRAPEEKKKNEMTFFNGTELQEELKQIENTQRNSRMEGKVSHMSSTSSCEMAMVSERQQFCKVYQSDQRLKINELNQACKKYNVPIVNHNMNEKQSGRIINIAEVKKLKSIIEKIQPAQNPVTLRKSPFITDPLPYHDEPKTIQQTFKSSGYVKKVELSRNSSALNTFQSESFSDNQISDDDSCGIPVDTLEKHNLINDKSISNFGEMQTSSPFEKYITARENYPQQNQQTTTSRYTSNIITTKLNMMHPKPLQKDESQQLIDSYLSIDTYDSKDQSLNLHDDKIPSSDNEQEFLLDNIQLQQDTYLKQQEVLKRLDQEVQDTINEHQINTLDFKNDEPYVEIKNDVHNQLSENRLIDNYFKEQQEVVEVETKEMKAQSEFTVFKVVTPMNKDLNNIDSQEHQFSSDNVLSKEIPAISNSFKQSSKPASQSNSNYKRSIDKENDTSYQQQELPRQQTPVQVSHRRNQTEESLPCQEYLAIEQTEKPLLQYNESNKELLVQSEIIVHETKAVSPVIEKINVKTASPSRFHTPCNRFKDRENSLNKYQMHKDKIRTCGKSKNYFNQRVVESQAKVEKEEPIIIVTESTPKQEYEDFQDEKIEKKNEEKELVDQEIAYCNQSLNKSCNQQQKMSTISIPNCEAIEKSVDVLDEYCPKILQKSFEQKRVASLKSISGAQSEKNNGSINTSFNHSTRYGKLAESIKKIREEEEVLNKEEIKNEAVLEQQMIELEQMTTPTPREMPKHVTVLDLQPATNDAYDDIINYQKNKIELMENERKLKSIQEQYQAALMEATLYKEEETTTEEAGTMDKDQTKCKLDKLLNEFLRENNIIPKDYQASKTPQFNSQNQSSDDSQEKVSDSNSEHTNNCNEQMKEKKHIKQKSGLNKYLNRVQVVESEKQKNKFQHEEKSINNTRTRMPDSVISEKPSCEENSSLILHQKNPPILPYQSCKKTNESLSFIEAKETLKYASTKKSVVNTKRSIQKQQPKQQVSSMYRTPVKRDQLDTSTATSQVASQAQSEVHTSTNAHSKNVKRLFKVITPVCRKNYSSVVSLITNTPLGSSRQQKATPRLTSRAELKKDPVFDEKTKEIIDQKISKLQKRLDMNFDHSVQTVQTVQTNRTIYHQDNQQYPSQILTTRSRVLSCRAPSQDKKQSKREPSVQVAKKHQLEERKHEELQQKIKQKEAKITMLKEKKLEEEYRRNFLRQVRERQEAATQNKCPLAQKTPAKNYMSKLAESVSNQESDSKHLIIQKKKFRLVLQSMDEQHQQEKGDVTRSTFSPVNSKMIENV